MVNTASADEVAVGAATEAVSADTKFKGMPPADATDAGAEATPVNFADAAAALGEADAKIATTLTNLGAAACAVEANIGEAKLPKFTGVAVEVVAKATTAEAVDAKAAKVEANAEVAAAAQAATYAPVTADVAQSASCAKTTATATADAIEANSVAENATATATAGTADAPEAKLKATSTDEPLLGNTGSGAKVALQDKAVARVNVTATDASSKVTAKGADTQVATSAQTTADAFVW